ncbi:MAG TPA: prepilin peptidase [Rhizomicrobium sp.]|jgi:prepilin peptidase CpaA
MIPHALVLFVLPGLLLAAAAWDLASYTIPNFLQAGLLAAFALLMAVHPLGAETFGMHLLAGFIGLVVGFTLFSLGYIGGGDAKLFACTALWFGMNDLLAYTLVASVFGGMLTLGLLAMRNLPLPAPLASQNWLLRLHDGDKGIPYGAALAAGAFFILSQSEIFRSALAG